MEANIDYPTKKGRVLALLVTARIKKQWVQRKQLHKIASRGYISRLLMELLDDGLIERKGARRNYFYRASDKLHKLLAEGRLPRSAPRRRLRKAEQPRAIEVAVRPIDEFVDPSGIWMEHQRLQLGLDGYTAEVIRRHCEPARQRDRAQQRSFSCKAFTVTISRRNTCSLILKNVNWNEALRKWLLSCGLSSSATNALIQRINGQLPWRFKRMEMPVLDRRVKRFNVEFVVSTRVGDDRVVSNINYSTDIDLEVFGSGFLVDNWLAAIASGQHNQVVALQAMEQKIADLVRQVEELRKENEMKEEVSANEPDYYF